MKFVWNVYIKIVYHWATSWVHLADTPIYHPYYLPYWFTVNSFHHKRSVYEHNFPRKGGGGGLTSLFQKSTVFFHLFFRCKRQAKLQQAINYIKTWTCKNKITDEPAARVWGDGCPSIRNFRFITIGSSKPPPPPLLPPSPLPFFVSRATSYTPKTRLKLYIVGIVRKLKYKQWHFLHVS